MHGVHPVANMKTVDFLSWFSYWGQCVPVSLERHLCNVEGFVTRMDPWYGWTMLPSVEFCTSTVQGSTLGKCRPAKSLIQLLGLTEYRNRSHYSHCKQKQDYSFRKCCTVRLHPPFHTETMTSWQCYVQSAIFGKPSLIMRVWRTKSYFVFHCRIIQRFGLQGNLKITQLQPLPRAGTLPTRPY